MWWEYTRKKYNFISKKVSLHNQNHRYGPIPFHKSRFVIFSKQISILCIFVFTFLLSCSICTELPVQEGLQKSTDKPRLVDRVSLSTIADIMVHDAQLKSAWDTENNSYNFEPIFSPVKDFLSAADLTIANLETTLPGHKKMKAGYPKFGTPDALVAALKGAGVDILTTANNHACNTGKQGLIRRILIVKRNHIRLVFLGYTYGLNCMPIPKGTYVNLTNQQQIMNDIQLARAQNPDFIIVLLHRGTEYERYPDQFQKKMVTFLFHEGADIVLGSHSHVLQPFELQYITDKYGDIKPRLVICSLGNFVSNQRDRYRDGGIIFNFTVQKHHSTDKDEIVNITNVHYIPTWVYIHRTTNKNQFYVLPVLKYLKNDQPLHLPDDAYQKMLAFYKDTQLHLQPSQKQVKKMMNRQQLEKKH